QESVGRLPRARSFLFPRGRGHLSPVRAGRPDALQPVFENGAADSPFFLVLLTLPKLGRNFALKASGWRRTGADRCRGGPLCPPYYSKPGIDRLIRIDYRGAKEVPTGTCQAILRAAGLRPRGAERD